MTAPPTLTEREREVAGMVARGMGNKAIAVQLGLAENTVKAHRKSFRTKLGLGNAADIARWYHETMQTTASP